MNRPGPTSASDTGVMVCVTRTGGERCATSRAFGGATTRTGSQTAPAYPGRSQPGRSRRAS